MMYSLNLILFNMHMLYNFWLFLGAINNLQFYFFLNVRMHKCQAIA